ncbi:hypothetical protein LS73_002215 [Helicobacter muridarum]|uniref:Poly(A) polymerase n=1 Tax=Helicobacter muridarum TaxID=216 RepID=A0A377PTP2_9HELI|nr:hypothetical protein [Helicobacter muridarum]TLE01112.1 hypothetical protein LS73_002215 [Helicobacter muridarum]STQ85977.1 poly(A) polymerase [Helicobacter muridarum]
MVLDSIKLSIPNALIGILQVLRLHGFEGCIVGGYVRDSICRILHHKNMPNQDFSSKNFINHNLLHETSKRTILNTLQDTKLKFTPKDWDIATNAKPSEVLEIFGFYNAYFKIIKLGIKYGTLGIRPLFTNDVGLIEITTYRIEGKYSDSRRPDNVIFTTSLQKDLARRDFSMNAIAFILQDDDSKEPQEYFTQDHCDINMRICDYFSGVESIKQKEIICVGDANMRFSEDALRIMRALRFGAVLQPRFDISKDTKLAIIACKRNLAHISKERILHEYNIMLLGSHVTSIAIDYRQVLEIIYPELSLMSKQQYYINMLALSHAPNILNVRLAIFFYSIDSKHILAALKRMRYDSKTLRDISKILALQNRSFPSSRFEIKESLGFAGEIIFKHYLQMLKAQALALEELQNTSLDIEIEDFELHKYKGMDISKYAINILEQDSKSKESSFKDKPKFSKAYSIADIEYIEIQSYDIIKSSECFLLLHLPIDGNDIMYLLDKQGINDKKMIGKLLNELLYYAMKQNMVSKQAKCKIYSKTEYSSMRDMLLDKAREMIISIGN